MLYRMWARQNGTQLLLLSGSSNHNTPLIALQISCCELLHEPVDLLGLSGEPEALQERPQSRNKVFTQEVHLIHIGVHHLFIETVIIP